MILRYIIVLMFGLCSLEARPPKIVALLPGHNDARFLPMCLKALSQYVDAIVYFDDASTDNSIEVVERMAAECRVEQIIHKKNWIRNEPSDRNMLLQAGRAIGGTHFVTIDADEMFTANCLNDNKIRNHILALKPGERLIMNWIQLWRSPDWYRFDDSGWTYNYKDFAFCDNTTCAYEPGFLHMPRTPAGLNGMNWWIEGYEYGVMHFQFINWRNLLVKQAWYRCMEHIYDPEKSIATLNWQYGQSKDETNLHCLPAPSYWFDNYKEFFDREIFNQTEEWRENDVLSWFAKYGIPFFIDLDIWDVDWRFDDFIAKNNPYNEYVSQVGQDFFMDTFVFDKSKKGFFVDIGAHDGKKYSNSLFFEKHRNWHGICIEPLQKPFEDLVSFRSAICIQGCVGDHDGIAEFISATGRTEQLSGLVDSYDPRHKERLQREIDYFGGSYEIITVPLFALNTILDDNKVNMIDFMSIDTEGSEPIILRAIDFEKYTIKALSVENNYGDNAVRKLLESKGFVFITKLGCLDEVYIRRNI